MLDGRLIGERAEEVNLAELLKVAKSEFNANENTLDEVVMNSEWPKLRSRLNTAMSVWEPIAEITKAQADAANPESVSVQPAFENDKINVVIWKERLKMRARHLHYALMTRTDLEHNIKGPPLRNLDTICKLQHAHAK